MSLTTTTRHASYTGNNVTTAFSFPIKFLANDHLGVYLDGSVKTLDTHYSVTGAGDEAGGTVTFVTAPGSSVNVLILRETPNEQPSDWVANSRFSSEDIETELDRQRMVEIDTKPTMQTNAGTPEAAVTGYADRGDFCYDSTNNILYHKSSGNGTDTGWEVVTDVTALGDVGDVTLTSIASGEILKWDGSGWINNTLAEAGISAVGHTHAASDVTSGTFADARISESSVTQHEAAIDHDALTNYAIAQHRTINDSGSATTDLFSADKILSLVGSTTAGVDLKDPVATSTEGLGNITLSGEQTLNGVTTSSSRILVSEQTTASENGIYVTAAGSWSRATDADEDDEVTNGMTCTVSDSNSDVYRHRYLLTTADPITVGSTNLTFAAIPDVEFGTTSGTATEGNDSRVPTQDENDALAGTDGAPSASNKYVTNSDSRMTDARTPTAHNQDASTITTGTFADARVAESNVTQHEAALSITESQISDLGTYTKADGSVPFTGAQAFATGSAAAPSITQSGNTDTGIHFGSVFDEVSIATNGTTRATVNSSGHFNPGTTGSYDMGSSLNEWRDIYLRNGIYSGYAEVAEISAPSTPGTGYGRVYAKTDGLLYFKNDAGTEYDLTGGGLSDVVDDTTPQLGGDLDVNGNGLDDSNGNELITFTETASAVNQINIANSATGNWPAITATGDDANVNIELSPKAAGTVVLGAATGTDASLTANGVDTNIDIDLQPKGAGIVKAGGVEVATVSAAQTLTNKTLGGATLSGDLNAGSQDVTALDNLQFSTSPASPLTAEGSLYWDASNHTVALKNDEADVTMQVGQELCVRVRNESGGTIANGEAVYQSGTETGGEERPLITKAQANSQSTAGVIGIATHSIENNTYGYVAPFGVINDLDTSSFSAGDPLYLSADTAGAVVNSEPTAPNYSIQVGSVITSNASTGNILVAIVPNVSAPVGDASELVVQARKGSAGTITAGQVVYQSGWHSGSGTMQVELADTNSSSTMPAIGIARESITNSSNGTVVLAGKLTGIDTSSFSVGDALYVSGTAGALTATRPTAATDDVQKIALCLRSNVSNGVIEIVGAGRSNDGPNKHLTSWFRIADNSDTTKLVDFDLSGITTGNVRTLTPPDFDGTIATLAGTETLTNKTISLGGNLTVGTNWLVPNGGYGFQDVSGNELLTFLPDIAAVNYLQLSNKATGGNPYLEAKGDDTNVGIELTPKGSGRVTAGGVNVPTISSTDTLTNKSISGDQIDSGTLPAARLGADSIDTITEIAAALKSGSDGTLVTGTAGTSGDLSQWNADGDLVDGPTPPSGTIVGTTDAQTLTNKTLGATTLSGDLTVSTYDFIGANGNTVLNFNDTSSAVNYVRVNNAITGSSPSVQALGSDASVDLLLQSKGAGSVVINDPLELNNNQILNAVIDASDVTTGTLPAARLPAASTSAVGGVELATAAETTTGTDTTRALTADGLAGSDFGKTVVSILVSDPNGDAITTGDGKAYWRVPSTLNGYNLVAVAATVTTVSSSGTPTVQIHNVTDTVDMLSTALTIDASETDSNTAATAAVINTSNDDVATADQLRIDIDTAGTGAKGLQVELTFQLP